MNKFLALFTLTCATIGGGFVASSYAQDGVPELPAPVQTLVDEGAQVRFLGKDKGFNGWLTIKNGQEQYFYAKPDNSAFVMGLLFDEKVIPNRV